MNNKNNTKYVDKNNKNNTYNLKILSGTVNITKIFKKKAVTYGLFWQSERTTNLKNLYLSFLIKKIYNNIKTNYIDSKLFINSSTSKFKSPWFIILSSSSWSLKSLWSFNILVDKSIKFVTFNS